MFDFIFIGTRCITCIDDEQITKIELGIKDLVESTKVNGEYCIQIVPRTNEDDYVYIEDGGGYVHS